MRPGFFRNPSRSDLADAIDHAGDEIGYRGLRPQDFRLVGVEKMIVDDLPDGLGWLESDASSIALPQTGDELGWEAVREELEDQTSSRDFSHIVEKFRQGRLAPGIIVEGNLPGLEFSDFEVFGDGRGRGNLANALGVPMMVARYRLKDGVMKKANRCARRIVARYLDKLGVIQHPPRKPRRYFQNMVKKFRDALAQIKRLERPLTNHKEEITDDFLHDSKAWFSLNDLKRIFEKTSWGSGAFSDLEDYIGSIDNMVETILHNDELSVYDKNRYWGFLQKHLGFLDDFLQSGQIPNLVGYIRDAEPRLRETLDYDEGYVEEGLRAGLVDDLVRFADLVDEIKAIGRDVRPKLDEFVRLYLSGWQKRDDARPASENVETLYHTSAKARQIKGRGFDLDVPETVGLGGSQGDKSGKPAISFTSDLYIAKEIMRTLREAIMVAKGQVKAHHIMDWAKRAGILDDVLSTFKMIRGDLDPQKKYHIMELYRLYLTFAEDKGKLRYNPLFFGDMESLMRKFKQVNPRNVGVLVCSVDMTDPNISYLPSMHEYRVAPKNVVSIDRIIS